MGLISDLKKMGDTIKKTIQTLIAALRMFPKVILLFEKLITLITKPHLFILLIVQIYIFMYFCVLWLLWIMFLRYLAHFVILVVLTVLNGLVFTLTILFTVFVSFWDCIIFKGWLYPLFYRFIGATENSPDGWLLNNWYHHNNKNESLFGMSRMKCPENYIPDGSTNDLFCKKISSDQFSYCPHANIQKQFFYGKTKGNRALKPFVPNVDFMNKSPVEKQKIINSKEISDRYEMDYCNTYTKNTIPLTKLICSSSDLSSGSENNTMQQTCAETFCSNGSWESFCGKINPIKQQNRKEIEKINLVVSTNTLQKAYYNTLIILILVTISNIMLNKVKNIH